MNTLERKGIILLGDLAIILSALGVYINDALDVKVESMGYKILFFSLGALLYLFLAYVLDFYNLERSLRTRATLSQSFYVVGSFCLIVYFFSVLFFDSSHWRIPLIIFLCLPTVAIFLWRHFFNNLFKVIPTTRNVLYVYAGNGKDNSIEKYIDLIDGEEINTFYKTKLTYSLEDVKFLEKGKFLEAINKIDSIILNLPGYDQIPLEFEKILLNAILNGKEVIPFTAFYQNTYEALPIRSHNDSFYEILQLRQKKIRYIERVFSFCINIILCLLVGPIFLVFIPFVAFFNLFFNKGPLFYTQKRVGLHGKEFNIYKFRSMVVDAEKGGAKMASKNDSRITPFGRILRLFRIDELPQIISVINGDMQFIGPRPERKVFVDTLKKNTPFYDARHLIKPGITGWAQVKYKYGENLEDSIRKLEYDLYYIKNKSVTLDLRILFKTITTVLFSRGV
ncbi:MAG: sugar transferase [Flavobacteriaceae bacterium]